MRIPPGVRLRNAAPPGARPRPPAALRPAGPDRVDLSGEPAAPSARRWARVGALVCLALVGASGVAAAQEAGPPPPEPGRSTEAPREREPRFSLGSRFRSGSERDYGLLEGSLDQPLGERAFRLGSWSGTLEAGGRVGFQAGRAGGRDGGNVFAGLEVNQGLERALGSTTLRLDNEAALQVGTGLQFDEHEPVSRLEVGSALTLEAGGLYAGPFLEYVHDLGGAANHHLEAGALVGHRRAVGSWEMEAEGRLWQTRRPGGETSNDAGVRVALEKEAGRVRWGPEVSLERKEGMTQVAGGVRLRF